jgi:hypothetical protein
MNVRGVTSSLFYPDDWLQNPALSRCSAAARGVWMDMLCLMFERRGVLSTGRTPWTDQEIAEALRGDTAANLECIHELLKKGVAHRNSSGAIFSGRLVRDEQALAVWDSDDEPTRQTETPPTRSLARDRGRRVTVMSNQRQEEPRRPHREEAESEGLSLADQLRLQSAKRQYRLHAADRGARKRGRDASAAMRLEEAETKPLGKE